MLGLQTCFLYRDFEEHTKNVREGRDRFKRERSTIQRTKKGRLQYPPELQELQFYEWLSIHIKEKNRNKEDVPDEIHAIANGCPTTATSYKGLYIGGQLFKTRAADFKYYADNSVIICQFIMDNNSNSEDSSTEIVEDFIGYIEEILEIDFIHLKKTFIMCKWFGSAQVRPNTSMKTDGYGFTLFKATSREISRSRGYGNPCAEPHMIRQAYTAVDPEDPNWITVVETILNLEGPERRYVPRLIGPELECDMERELTIPPAYKNGGKTITFSSRQNVNDAERSAGPTLDPIIEVHDDDDDNNPNINDDEQNYAAMMEEGDEDPTIVGIDNTQDEEDFLNDDELTEAEDDDDDMPTSSIPSIAQQSIVRTEGPSEPQVDTKGKRVLEDDSVGIGTKRLKFFNKRLNDYL